MAGWHHQLDGRGFGWTPGVGDGQGGLACCNSWGHKESDTTERLYWTERENTLMFKPTKRNRWDHQLEQEGLEISLCSVLYSAGRDNEAQGGGKLLVQSQKANEKVRIQAVPGTHHHFKEILDNFPITKSPFGCRRVYLNFVILCHPIYIFQNFIFKNYRGEISSYSIILNTPTHSQFYVFYF